MNKELNNEKAQLHETKTASYAQEDSLRNALFFESSLSD